MGFGTAWALFRPTDGRHSFAVAHSGGSWDNFNALLVSAINAYEAGGITHAAQIHGDIEPEMTAGILADGTLSGEQMESPHWLDILLEEMDATGAALVSAAVPIKDHRGLLSCGLGNPVDPWSPFRRLTMHELAELPDTFDAADIAVVHGHGRDYYDGHPLLHNNGLWVADLRNPVFHRRDANGDLVSYFNFPKKVSRDNGKWKVYGESEDWWMSRHLHVPGVKTCITKKVRLIHKDGGTPYPNYGVWGTFQHDEHTATKWRAREEAEAAERLLLAKRAEEAAVAAAIAPTVISTLDAMEAAA